MKISKSITIVFVLIKPIKTSLHITASLHDFSLNQDYFTMLTSSYGASNIWNSLYSSYEKLKHQEVKVEGIKFTRAAYLLTQ